MISLNQWIFKANRRSTAKRALTMTKILIDTRIRTRPLDKLVMVSPLDFTTCNERSTVTLIVSCPTWHGRHDGNPTTSDTSDVAVPRREYRRLCTSSWPHVSNHAQHNSSINTHKSHEITSQPFATTHSTEALCTVSRK